jgi:hypothetical protein
VENKSEGGRITVESHRQWFGDQRLGTWTVYVDRNAIGKLSPEGVVECRCPTGIHVVRIRQWWYWSESVEVDVLEGLNAIFEADIPRNGSLLVRLLKFVFVPGRALLLTKI